MYQEGGSGRRHVSGARRGKAIPSPGGEGRVRGLFPGTRKRQTGEPKPGPGSGPRSFFYHGKRQTGEPKPGPGSGPRSFFYHGKRLTGEPKPSPGKRTDLGRSKCSKSGCVIRSGIYPSRNLPTNSFEEADFCGLPARGSSRRGRHREKESNSFEKQTAERSNVNSRGVTKGNPRRGRPINRVRPEGARQEKNQGSAMSRLKKPKKPKLRIPVPPPDRPHGDRKKEEQKKVCRKKVEKDPAL